MSSVFKKKNLPQHNSPGSKRNALECVPIKNPELEEAEDKNGDLCLTYPVKVKPWFQSIFKNVTRNYSGIITRKLQLDTLGTSVWQMIDGHMTVNDIIHAFQAEHTVNRREAEISVSAFMKELGKRGLVAMREEKR